VGYTFACPTDGLLALRCQPKLRYRGLLRAGDHPTPKRPDDKGSRPSEHPRGVHTCGRRARKAIGRTSLNIHFRLCPMLWGSMGACPTDGLSSPPLRTQVEIQGLGWFRRGFVQGKNPYWVRLSSRSRSDSGTRTGGGSGCAQQSSCLGHSRVLFSSIPLQVAFGCLSWCLWVLVFTKYREFCSVSSAHFLLVCPR
jgi:hypothetical protein